MCAINHLALGAAVAAAPLAQTLCPVQASRPVEPIRHLQRPQVLQHLQDALPARQPCLLWFQRRAQYRRLSQGWFPVGRAEQGRRLVQGVALVAAHVRPGHQGE